MTSSSKTTSPMLDLNGNTHETQVVIMAFLEWCEEQDLELRYVNGDDYHVSNLRTVQRYFGIDPERLEKERSALLKEIQEHNKNPGHLTIIDDPFMTEINPSEEVPHLQITADDIEMLPDSAVPNSSETL